MTGLLILLDRRTVDEHIANDGNSVTSELHIASVVPGDSGQYRCTSSNEHSQDDALFSLTVIGEQGLHRIICF